MRRALDLNGLRPSLFVEPFAGGASVALQLATEGVVDQIGLVDKDPLVAAFWWTVFFDTEWLVRRVETLPVSLDDWKRWRKSKPTSVRYNALKCLFLNRTSFSGILAPTAGPIGGWKQRSEYDIACRFPRATLAKRIQQAGTLRSRVAFVWLASWDVALDQMKNLQRAGKIPRDVFLYCDPPFFEKADRLYTHHFDWSEHERLRDHLIDEETPWMLSYDSAEKVQRLYGRVATHVNLLYSVAATPSSREVREIVLSNLSVLPEQTRLWRTNAEWHSRLSTESGVVDNGFKTGSATL